ncbi:tyrosine-type recombinase/integrase [Gemmiger sp.]
MPRKVPVLNAETIRRYLNHLKEQERAAATVQKYRHDLTALCSFLQGAPLTKAALIAWKQALVGQYAPASVNSMLTVVNGYLRYMGWQGLCVCLLKVQKALFLDERKELSRTEYARLVRAAQMQQNERLALVLQTLCATGIRVSELRFITAEAVQAGRAEVCNKGKRRLVFLPDKLRRLLKAYLRKQKKAAGAVFTTRTGKPLDRSNIWRAMKALCKSAGVTAEKVFPHNLRHLFARVFYALEKDLSRLADILGHSSVNTTRIYTAESGAVHARQMNRLELVVT